MWAGTTQSCSFSERCWTPSNALHFRIAQAQPPPEFHLGKPDLGTASRLCASVLLMGHYCFSCFHISVLISSDFNINFCSSSLKKYLLLSQTGKAWGRLHWWSGTMKKTVIHASVLWKIHSFSYTKVPTVVLYTSYWLPFANVQNWLDLFFTSMKDNEIILKD